MFKNQLPVASRPIPEPGTMTVPEVLRIVTDSFTSATERHIEVGDGLEMYIVRVPGSAASEVQLQSAVEATGGEDTQTPGATVVLRRELKKD